MKKIYLLFVLACLFSSQIIAQEKSDLDVIAKIREEGFQRSQVMDIVSYITDVHGNRLVGSLGIKKAQEWAKVKMEEIGLENTFIEPIMDHGVSWDNEYISIHMLEPGYYPIQGFPLGYTSGTRGRITGQVVIADINSKKDYVKYQGKLNDKIVLISPLLVIDPTVPIIRGRRTEEDLNSLLVPSFPKLAQNRPRVTNPDQVSAVERLEFLKSEGVSLVIECRSGRLGVVRTFGRPGCKDDRWSREGIVNSVPMISVLPEQYNRMYRIIERGIPVKLEAEIRNRIGDETQVNNVLGEIPGTDLKDEIVMLGSHFDSWHTSPGATDNASGCSVMLEAMRILKAIDAKPRRTIRIAFWSGEEDGIHGSGYYVKKYFGDPETGLKPGYDKFSVYYNMDYDKGQFRGIYLQGNEFVRQVFTKWTGLFNDLGMTTISPRSVGSTDHVPFDRAGLPAFQFLQDRIGQGTGHTNLDFYENLVQEDLMKNAVIMASFIYLSAMTDEKMPRKNSPIEK
ncbi:MAG: M20/M25/M40 family metallo-hydrolase [bacterium]|nr:M20/M25/M40 family metallo-hydrolase [bacterium]